MFQISAKHRKLKFSSCHNVPSVLQVRSSLGTSLAELFFKYSHDEVKTLLGSVTPPKFPERSLALATNDTTNKHTIIKSAMYHEILKSDIHNFILELGEELLKKFEVEVKDKLQETIESQFQEKFYMYQAEKRREIELNKQELHDKYENYIKTVQSELQEKLEIEWADLNAKWEKRIQKEIVQERINLTREILRKMRVEISYIIKELYNEFEQSFRAQKEQMIADFNEIMRKEHVRQIKDIKEFERKKTRDLCIQRCELEIQNATDIMFVLCLERSRSSKEKHILHTHFEKELSTLRDVIADLNKTIDQMKNDIVESQKKRKQLEERISEVTKEFQKFINFVLRAVPGQAEFLLPPELLRSITLDKDAEDNAQTKGIKQGLREI